MRKLLLALIIIIASSLHIGAMFEYKKTRMPPPVEDSCDVSLYGNYMSWSYPSIKMLLQPKYDFQVYMPGITNIPGYHSDTIGQWRTNGDTLLIYEDYFHEGVDPDIPEEEILELGYAEGLINSYRWLVSFLPLDSDYPYEANISAFKVLDYGNEIQEFKEYNHRGCIWKFVYVPKYLYNYFSWENIKQMWIMSQMEWSRGEFMVRKIHKVHDISLVIDIEKDGILFQIVNPKYYLKHDTVKYYDPDDEHALSGWMDSVDIGRRYRFALQRPDYPTDSASHVRYLRTLPDSIYISTPIARSTEPLPENHEQFPDTCREAYGYFFARMMK